MAIQDEHGIRWGSRGGLEGFLTLLLPLALVNFAIYVGFTIYHGGSAQWGGKRAAGKYYFDDGRVEVNEWVFLFSYYHGWITAGLMLSWLALLFFYLIRESKYQDADDKPLT